MTPVNILSLWTQRRRTWSPRNFICPEPFICVNGRGIKGGGIAANKLFLISSDDNLLSVYAIRAERFLRESGLTWLYLWGI